MGLIFFLIGIATNPEGSFARPLHDAFSSEVPPYTVSTTILLEPASKLLSVLANAWSRKHEFEADAYASQATGSPEALGDTLKQPTTDHLSHPAPHKLRIILDYSHPPLLQRLQALAKT